MHSRFNEGALNLARLPFWYCEAAKERAAFDLRDHGSMSITNIGPPPRRSFLDRIQRRICNLVLSGIAITVAAVVGRGASARRRLSDGPVRLLVEPSDYLLRNVGDMAMMQIAIERLAAL